MKQRIITAAFGIAFVLIWLSLSNTIVFNIVIAIAVLLAMFEALIGTRIVKNLPLIVLCMLYSATVPFFELTKFFPTGIGVSIVFMVALIIIMLWQHEKISLLEVSYSFMMTLLVPFSISSILYINSIAEYNPKYAGNDGFFFVMLALAAAWIADSGAYFAGKFLGKHKLAPTISPKKTIEGSVGGILATIVFMVIFAFVWHLIFLKDTAKINYLILILYAIVSSICGMMGDLTFSFIKRKAKIKDFGKIMPGHGGLLDRIDSLIVTAPITLVAVQIVNIVVR